MFLLIFLLISLKFIIYMYGGGTCTSLKICPQATKIYSFQFEKQCKTELNNINTTCYTCPSPFHWQHNSKAKKKKKKTCSLALCQIHAQNILKGRVQRKKDSNDVLFQSGHIHYPSALPRGPARPHTGCHLPIQHGVTLPSEADFGFTVLKGKKMF